MVAVVKLCPVKFCTTLHIARINVQCDIYVNRRSTARISNDNELAACATSYSARLLSQESFTGRRTRARFVLTMDILEKWLIIRS